MIFCFDRIAANLTNLKFSVIPFEPVWFDEIKKRKFKRSLFGIIPTFIEGLYDIDIKHDMTVWRQKNPRFQSEENFICPSHFRIV